MSVNVKRQLTFGALITIGIIVGIIIASSTNWTPASQAEKVARNVAAAASARPAATVAIPSFADLASEAMPSVVSITSTDIVKGPSNPFFGGDGGGSDNPFQFFFGYPPRNQGQQEHKETAGGSGFIISPDGYILTNNHVIAKATKIQVRINNNMTYQARVVGTDPATDLALLKIDTPEKLQPIALGNSDSIRVGDWVMAIGDPWDFDRTVTVGVISAKGRHNLSSDPGKNAFENFLQTDAAINPGNSGGPLIDVQGEVIGINTAIYRPAQNIGFAIPINTARAILDQLKTRGKVVRGFLGIDITPISEDYMKGFNLPSMNGALVQSVEPGSPAEKAGIEHGDVVTRVDSEAVNTPQDLIDYVSARAPGTDVRVTVIRGGHNKVLTVKLGQRNSGGADQSAGTGSDKGDSSRKIGLTIQDLTPQARRYYQIPSSVEGALVTDVKEISAAADAGIQEGDVITEANGQKVSNSGDLTRIVRGAQKGDYLRLYVRTYGRQPFARYAIVKVGEQ